MFRQESDPVKLLVSFPSQANLDHISEMILDQYFFIQGVKKHAKSELLISFDSMSDLLEIDFVQQFGALSTKVKNSNSFCKQMNEEYHNSTSDAGSSNKIIKCCDNPDKFKSENTAAYQVQYKRTERLTSLEDEVIQGQELIRKLALFDQPLTFSRVQSVNKNQESTQSEIQLSFQDKQPQKERQSMWGTVFHGVAITSLLLGGMKALKYFMK